MEIRSRSILLYVGSALSLLVLIAGVGLFAYSEGLGRASMLAGIVSMIVGLTGLVVTVFGGRSQKQGPKINILGNDQVFYRPGDVYTSKTYNYRDTHSPERTGDRT